MFTRCSKRVFLLALAITAVGAVPRQSAAVVVSQTFNLPIPSPDDPDSAFGRGRMDDAIIDITEHHLIEDLDVAVLLTHGAFLDLEIVLQSPTGITITLNPAFNTAFIIQEGGSHSAGGQNRFLFDDEAAVDIEHATQPFDQPFRPATGFELSVFDGQDAFGQWRLQIRDAGIDNIGRLEGAELIITTPEPTTIVLLAIGAAAVYMRKAPPHRIEKRPAYSV
ncbi:MAG: proprotein convertase P-domain-containing protein [Planctomycetota bacterium]